MAKSIDLHESEVKLGRDRRAVRHEIQRIIEAAPGKLLKAEAVVDRARDESNCLHPYFEWSDSKAAEKYRLSQARALIRTIEVVFPDDKQEKFVQKFVSLHTDRNQPGGGYRELKQVVGNKKFLTELEETCKKDLDAVLHRYEILKDLCTKVRQVIK